MKCPKCGYLGFESVDRCRNCGYDFALTNLDDLDLPELPIRSTEWKALPDDLELGESATDPANPPSASAAPSVLSRRTSPGASPGAPSAELPLFGGGQGGTASLEDDEPLIKRAAAPRPPLAVRRATPEVPRLRSEQPRTANLDLGLELGAADLAARSAPSDRGRAPWPVVADGDPEDATLGARVAAVLIDVTVLAVIDVLVVYFTLQICGIAAGEWPLLPKGPLLAFLVIQNGGYLVAFTAGGQTLGKMTAGIRVVSADGSTLDIGRAVVRTLFWVLLAVPAGLGFLSAVFSRDHRGFHDRVASTRVVRAA